VIRVLVALFVALAFLLVICAALVEEETRTQVVTEDIVRVPPRFPRSSSTTVPPSTTTTHVRVIQPTTTIRSAPTERTPITDAIRRGFARFGPEVAEEAVRVAGCETGDTYYPGARNGQHLGLFQISRTYHEDRVRRLGFTWEQMAEVDPNIAVAVDIYAESGWGPWTCRRAA
jgi:hypothetical protein